MPTRTCTSALGRNFGRTALSLMLTANLAISLPVWAENLPSPIPVDSKNDLVAPMLHGAALKKSPQGGTSLIINVSDDVGIASVVLHYRVKGQSQWLQVNMTAPTDTSTYSAPLSEEATNSSVIEYFVKAKDTAGNSVSEGQEFSPRVVVINVPVAGDPSAAAGNTDKLPGMATSNKSDRKDEGFQVNWWYVAAGVAAVALAAGGGGGGGDPAPPPETTGTLTVNAPIPQ